MIRPVAFAALTALTLSAHAQLSVGMNEATMQQMMQGMQALQTCMENVDQAALERLGEQAEQVEAEVKTLCMQGKRDAAQARAVAYGMQVAKEPAVQAMAECGKEMQGMMPQMQSLPYADIADDHAAGHVCDE